MNVNIQEKKLENARMEITVEIPMERIAGEYEKVFKKIQKTAKLDGFRPGKAPLDMVKARFKEHADQDVVENIVKDSYMEAVREKDLHPISYPKFTFPEQLKAESNFTFVATFDTPPTIELGNYRGIAVEERQCNLSDLDVMEEIENIREKHAIVSAKEEGQSISRGDITKIKIKRIDNLKPELVDAAEYREITVYAGQREDEFEFDNHVIGMNLDQEKDVTFTYPKDYQYKSLAGQTQTFKVKIAEIQKRTLPELDDEFAKDCGEYDSLDDMKKKTRERIEKFVSEKGRGEAKGEILKKIVDNSTYAIPDSMIEEERNAVFERLCQRIGFKAESIEQIAPFFGMKPDELSAKLREEAIQSIKTTLAVTEITKKEEMKATEEKFNEAVANISVSMKKDESEIRGMIEKNGMRSRIESEILYNNAVDFVYEQAKVKKLKPESFKDFMAVPKN
jgi:trigger factor